MKSTTSQCFLNPFPCRYVMSATDTRYELCFRNLLSKNIPPSLIDCHRSQAFFCDIPHQTHPADWATIGSIFFLLLTLLSMSLKIALWPADASMCQIKDWMCFITVTSTGLSQHGTAQSKASYATRIFVEPINKLNVVHLAPAVRVSLVVE